MKLKIPKRENASRVLSIRIPESEYEDLRKVAEKAEMDIAPLVRAILSQAVKQGIEVSK